MIAESLHSENKILNKSAYYYMYLDIDPGLT